MMTDEIAKLVEQVEQAAQAGKRDKMLKHIKALALEMSQSKERAIGLTEAEYTYIMSILAINIRT
jgi:hypothetical protein